MNGASFSNRFPIVSTRVRHCSSGGDRFGSPPEEPITTRRTVDYRFTLANERTYLAWIRTALAFLAGGVAIIHLLPDTTSNLGATLVALPLLTLAFAISIVALRRWRLNDAAIERDAPLPKPSLPLILAVSIASMALVAGLVIVLAGVWPHA